MRRAARRPAELDPGRRVHEDRMTRPTTASSMSMFVRMMCMAYTKATGRPLRTGPSFVRADCYAAGQTKVSSPKATAHMVPSGHCTSVAYCVGSGAMVELAFIPTSVPPPREKD